MLDHRRYSTDRLLFPNVKLELKGIRFESGDSAKGKEIQQADRNGFPALLCTVENLDGAVQGSQRGDKV